MKSRFLSFAVALAMAFFLSATCADATELDKRQPPTQFFNLPAYTATASFLPDDSAAEATATTLVASAPQQYYRRGYRRSYWRPRAFYYSYPRSTYGYPYANFYRVPGYPGYPGFYGGSVYFVPYNGIYRW